MLLTITICMLLTPCNLLGVFIAMDNQPQRERKRFTLCKRREIEREREREREREKVPGVNWLNTLC